MCPLTGLELEATGHQGEALYQSIKNYQPIPRNMSVVYWNARGIDQALFKKNFRHIMEYHNIDIIVLVETGNRDNIATIVSSLPLTAWYLVEPMGFAEGILILWKPW